MTYLMATGLCCQMRPLPDGGQHHVLLIIRYTFWEGEILIGSTWIALRASILALRNGRSMESYTLNLWD